MDFRTAASFTLYFGKYTGKTLDQIAESDEGLLYLDWLLAEGWLGEVPKMHVKAYLGDLAIAKDLTRAVEDRDHS